MSVVMAAILMHKRINMHMNTTTLPTRFCWTRFGTESGESISSILERKEQERLRHGGMFLWGIGNSVAPAIEELVRLEAAPKVLFSPMKSKPKAIDVAPSRVFSWNTALALDGQEWPIPEGLNVLSRGSSESGRLKRSHYALVCRSTRPLLEASIQEELVYDDLVNLLSQAKLGHSQVTAVVSHHHGRAASRNKSYSVGFIAELVYPYFVRLIDPILLDEPEAIKGRSALRSGGAQPSRLAF